MSLITTCHPSWDLKNPHDKNIAFWDCKMEVKTGNNQKNMPFNKIQEIVNIWQRWTPSIPCRLFRAISSYVCCVYISSVQAAMLCGSWRVSYAYVFTQPCHFLLYSEDNICREGIWECVHKNSQYILFKICPCHPYHFCDFCKDRSTRVYHVFSF